MKKMDKNELMAQMAQHGYALMRPQSTEPVEKLLENLLNQDDVRLLEGFPVVFASLLREKAVLDWEKKNWRPANDLSKKMEHRLAVMMALSYSLFRLFGLDAEYAVRTSKLLFRCEAKTDALKNVSDAFSKSQPVKMGGLELSPERLKNTFCNYVIHSEEKEEVRKKRQALEFDLLLSQLFTVRQKELLNKRLEGKSMTKTEREYFYRVVSKRLKALASEEVHQMARTLVAK